MQILLRYYRETAAGRHENANTRGYNRWCPITHSPLPRTGVQEDLVYLRAKRASDSNDPYYGYRLGLTEKGYTESRLMVTPGDYTPESGYRAAEEHLPRTAISTQYSRPPVAPRWVVSPTAPPKASVYRTGWPSLTTVRQPVYKLGRHAVAQLLQRTRSDRRNENVMILSPKLMIRRSTITLSLCALAGRGHQVDDIRGIGNPETFEPLGMLLDFVSPGDPHRWLGFRRNSPRERDPAN